jgi:hypothetical protein
MSMFTIYLILQLDNIIGLFGIAGSILIVSSFVCLLLYIDEPRSNFLIKSKILLTLGIIFLFPIAFMPSTRSACVIYALPKILNNEAFTKDTEEIYNLGVEKLKTILKKEENVPN